MSLSCEVNNEETNRCLEDEQLNRALQREKFLRCISSIVGERCDAKTIELNSISGHYYGMDIHVQEIFMKKLLTPYSELKNGLLRTQDLLYISFPDVGNSSKPKVKEEEDEDLEKKVDDSLE